MNTQPQFKQYQQKSKREANRKVKSQRVNKTSPKTSTTDVLQQDQVLVQKEKQVEDKTEVFVTKGNSIELLFYTQKNTELCDTGVIRISAKQREFCVFCKDNHNVSVYPKVKVKKNTK